MNMRRDIFSLVAVCAFALLFIRSYEINAQVGYTYAPWHETDVLPNGQPRPLDFMSLGDANHTYVRCRYGSGGTSRDYNSSPGIRNQNNPNTASHLLITQNAPDQCRCYLDNGSMNYENFLPPSWDGIIGHTQDKVIRLGCSQGTQDCYKAQEIEYWFYPPKDSSTLLVYFTFAEEDYQSHDLDWNPKFWIEVLDGTSSSTNTLVPSDNYMYCDNNTQSATGTPNPSWPYNRFLAAPPGNSNPEYTTCGPDEFGVTTYYWAHTSETPTTPTTFPYRICPNNPTSGHSNIPIKWFEFKPLAFNLKSYADQGKAVRLRIRSAACKGIAHWAYGMFAAKLMPGYISVDACGDDVVTLTVPWGFRENSYEWHYGKEPASSSNILDFGDPPAGVSGTTYNVIIDPTAPGARVWPYYRCEMQSYTGVPFTYEAYIKLYKIEPAFTYEQIVDTNYKCSHIIQLIDTGKVFELTPKENGQDYDTTSQTPLKEIKWYYMNRVGEYKEIPGSSGKDTCRFNVTNTPDIDLTNFNYGPGGDSIMIKLVMQDSLKKCIDSIEMKIGLDSTFVQPGTKDTTVRICSNQLPYFYQPDKYGQTYRWDYAGTKECHVGNDFEDWSWNYCDSIVKVTLEVMTPRVEIKDLGDYCDSFRTTLTVIPAPNQTFNQEDIQVLNWNGEEYSTGITYPVDHAGVYTVDVSIGAGCVTSASYKVAACMPFMNLPGSITPSNHDGINDCFEIPQKDLVQSLEFTVYNRNGTVVFHTKDVNFKWRGARFSEDYPEKELVNQTYVYTLKMVDYNGKPYPVMKGVILVL